MFRQCNPISIWDTNFGKSQSMSKWGSLRMDTVMGRRCLFNIENNLETNLTITNTCRIRYYTALPGRSGYNINEVWPL